MIALLRVHFGIAGKTLNSIKPYFLNSYNDAWLTTEFSKDAIKHIDKSELIGPNLIISPFLGPIPPAKLSDGVLGVILMAYDKKLKECDWIGEYFGDNTLLYIMKASEIAGYDIRMATTHIFKFPEKFEQGVYMEDADKIIYTHKEFMEIYRSIGNRLIKIVCDPEYPGYIGE